MSKDYAEIVERIEELWADKAEAVRLQVSARDVDALTHEIDTLERELERWMHAEDMRQELRGTHE